MRNANITYFLGAGASARAIPISQKLLGDVKAQATRRFIHKEGAPESEWCSAPPEMVADFTWLASEAAHHASVDTFARKLFLTERAEELHKLKRVLSYYFML